MALVIRDAMRDDAPALRAFLDACGVPSSDVAIGPQAYVLALEDHRIVGSVGLEPAGEDALLRSLAVAADRRGRGLAGALHLRAITLARSCGVRTLWLLTTTVEPFASRRGFERVDRSAAPPGIAALPQLRSICGPAAVCMRLDLAHAR